MKKLSNCTRLKHLDVRECRRLAGSLSDLRSMTRLTHLFTNMTAIEGNTTDIKQFKVRWGGAKLSHLRRPFSVSASHPANLASIPSLPFYDRRSSHHEFTPRC